MMKNQLTHRKIKKKIIDDDDEDYFDEKEKKIVDDDDEEYFSDEEDEESEDDVEKNKKEKKEKKKKKKEFGVEASASAAIVSTGTSVAGGAVAGGAVAGGISFTTFFITIAVLVAAITITGGFFGYYNLNVFLPFFNNELPLLRNLEKNITINETGTYFSCPTSSNPIQPFCTISDQLVTINNNIALINAFLGTNFTAGNFTTQMVFDIPRGKFQQEVNDDLFADIATNTADIASDHALILIINGQIISLQSQDAYLLGLILNLTGTVNNIGSNVVNGSILSTQVFDVPSNMTQKDLNLYFKSQLDYYLTLINGIQVKFVNGSIVTSNVYDSAFSQNQSYLNQYFNNTIASLSLNNGSVSLPAYQIIQLDANLGNDLTCDGSLLRPCASYGKAQLLMTSSSILYLVVFNAGSYSEGSSTSIKPNQILLGNEGVSLSFNGISFNAVAWNATGSGTIIFKNFKSLQCSGTCLLNAGILNPYISFSVRFIDCEMSFSTLLTIDGFSFNPSPVSSSVTFEGSTSIMTGVVFISDVLNFEWSGTGSNYGTFQVFRNFTAGDQRVKFNGVTNNGGSITIMNAGALTPIDLTIIRLIQLNNATFTINKYTSGSSFAIHADLSIGVTNGGLIIVGPGGHTMEYLQYAVGLGYIASNPSYWTALGFSVPVDVNTALNNLASAAYSAANSITALETVPNVPIIFVEMAGNDLTCTLNNQRLPCASPERATEIMGNVTDSNTPWIIQFGTGFWFTTPNFKWPCNAILEGTEASFLYLNGTTLDIGKAANANGGACVTKVLYMTIIPQTNILIDFSSFPSLTYIEIDWLNCTIRSGAFLFTFTGNTGFNIMNFDTIYINDLTFFTLNNFHWTSANNGKFFIPMIMNSNNGKSLFYDVRASQFLSSFNINTNGSVVTLIKIYSCYEEQGSPTLFSVIGNNTITALECDALGCGLTNVNEDAFTGTATVIIRRNTNTKGPRYSDCGTPTNWNGAVCPSTLYVALEQIGDRLTTLENQGINWHLLNRGLYPSGTIPSTTIPNNVFEVTFIIIGAGGGGSGRIPSVTAGCGGGAAARTTITIPVSVNFTFNGYIGAGGIDSTDGQASYICINGVSDCYYAGGGGGATTGGGACTPGAGGSNDPISGSAVSNTPGTASSETNAFAGAAAGISGCTSAGINGKTTGDFGSGASGGCALNLGGRTYGGVAALPAQPGHSSFGGGDGAAGWANYPGQGGPDLLFTTCDGGAAGDGGGGGGGGAILLGFDPCPGGGSGGNGGHGIVFYQLHYSV